MKKLLALSLVACAALACATAQAQETKLTFAMSGWTGFAPLTLAKEAGIFKKNGLDVTIKKIPQKDRHLAIASGDVHCAATTVETWIAWNANGVPYSRGTIPTSPPNPSVTLATNRSINSGEIGRASCRERV